MAHCRAEQAAKLGRWHLAVMNYHCCLEAAERREDVQATQFFALRLAECYAVMGLAERALAFQGLAGG